MGTIGPLQFPHTFFTTPATRCIRLLIRPQFWQKRHSGKRANFKAGDDLDGVEAVLGGVLSSPTPSCRSSLRQITGAILLATT